MTSQTKEKNYRWNFTVNLLDGASFWFGASFISVTTIIPLFISKLTPSLFPIALISVIASAGWFLPQLFAARITERFSSMKSIVIGWGLFLERMPVWMMGVSAFIARQSPTAALVIFLISYTWFSIGSGVVSPSWMALVAKIFSPEKRGSFLGTTTFIGAGMGVLGSALSAWLLEAFVFPNSFMILFGIAAFFITVSWFLLRMTREPKGEVEVVDQDWAAYWKDLLNILKTDRNFRRYVIASIVITLGGMGTGFVTVSAIQRFQIPDSTVGLFTLAMLVGQTAGNLGLGWMADRFGHKLSQEIGVFALFAAFLLAVFAPSPTFYYLAYVLLGINFSSGSVSGLLLVWEFCENSRVPTYSGLVNTTRGIISLAAPMVAAQIAQIGYEPLFIVCTILTVAGLLLLRLWVREPRWEKA